MKSCVEIASIDTVAQCLQKYCRGKSLDRSTRLSELKLDSLDLIEALSELEQLHDRRFSNVDLASLSTIEDLVEALAGSTSEQ